MDINFKMEDKEVAVELTDELSKISFVIEAISDTAAAVSCALEYAGKEERVKFAKGILDLITYVSPPCMKNFLHTLKT